MTDSRRAIQLWERVAGQGATLIIAEIANAHEGSAAAAAGMVRAAAESGADAVKFQCFSADELAVAQHPKHERWAGFSLSEAEWTAVVAEGRRCGVFVLCDVFGPWSADLMQRLGVDGFEIHASDTLNAPLLRRVAAFGCPVFVSTSGGTFFEIAEALREIRSNGNEQIVLLHGYQGFPTAIDETHLQRLITLRQRFAVPVGVSDHVDGGGEPALMVPVAALGAGIRVIEKHLTLDRSKQGVDYFSALEPDRFAMFVRYVRQVEGAVGDAAWSLSESERTYRRTMRKQLTAARALPRGATLCEDDLSYRRAEAGVEPLWWEEAVGKRLARDVSAGEPLTRAHLEQQTMIAIIARMHSTRLPGKALKDIAGQTAIECLIDRALLCASGAPVLCTSDHPDDAVLVPLAERKGIPCFRGSQDDVLKRLIDAAHRHHADIVVRVTGDDILLDPEHLDKAVAYHASQNADYTRMGGLPKGTECEVFSTTALQRAHRYAEDPSQTEYLTWYFDDPSLFRLAVLPVDERFRRPYRLTLDTPEDLEVVKQVVEALTASQEAGGAPYRLADVIAYMDAHPELAARNRAARPKLSRDAINTRFRAEVAG